MHNGYAIDIRFEIFYGHLVAVTIVSILWDDSENLLIFRVFSLILELGCVPKIQHIWTTVISFTTVYQTAFFSFHSFLLSFSDHVESCASHTGFDIGSCFYSIQEKGNLHRHTMSRRIRRCKAML